MAVEGFKRKLTAILSADVEGYSRLMAEDEEATVRTLTAYREVFTTLIQQHNGRIIDSPGDNLLVEFASVVDAVQSAVAVQKELKSRNDELPENRRMQFRIGINLGDVIQEKERIYGDGVNIAARLEGLADPGGICISKTAFDHIESKLPYGYDFIGDQTVKNIAKPIGAYRVLMEPRVTVSGKPLDKKPTGKRLVPILVGVAAVLVLAVAVGIWQDHMRGPSEEPASVEKMKLPLPDKPSIAVLPFVNLSGVPEHEHFADAISENITTELSRFEHLFVIARQSAFVYKESKEKTKQISQELGVRYLLKGSVQRSDNQVRINAQLIDAISGEHVWTEKFDRNISNIFAIQDEITLTVVNTLSEKIWQVSAKTLSKKPLSNFNAWDYLLRGSVHYRKMSKQENATARTFYEKALELDPDLSAAYIWLAWTYYIDWRFFEAESEALDKVEALANKAAAFGENKADLQFLLSRIALGRGRYDEAFAHMEQALELNPNDAEIIYNYGTLLIYAGRSEESIPWFKKAMRLNPYYPDGWSSFLGAAYYYTQRYGEVVDVLFRKERLNFGDHELLAASYAQLGRMDKARAHVKEILKIKPQFTLAKFRTYLQRLYKNETDIEHIIDGLRRAGLPEHPPFKLPDKPSIAVLPFVNMSGDQEQEYFSDGISEDIITALSKTPKLFVIARTSSFKYKGKEKDIGTVGRELGVGYVLEGSVRKAGDEVRITAQLIDATTEKHLWAERYDRNLREIFAIQDEITLAIIKAMQVELTKGEMADLTGRGTKNLDAYLKALQAQEQWWRMDKQGTLKAKQLALEAIAIDPQYGYPYAIVSWSHMMDVWLQSSESPKESMALAVEAIQKARALDESDHRIHIVLSNLYIMQGKNDKAISSAQRALELCPGGSLAHAVLGTALRFACRFSEAVQFREQAIKLDPFPTALDFRNLAVAYSKAGRYEDAIAEYKKALQTNPNDWAVHFGMVEAYAKLNRKEEARIAAKELLRIRPDFSLNWLAETIVQMYAKECRSKINDDIESLRRADVGLQ